MTTSAPTPDWAGHYVAVLDALDELMGDQPAAAADLIVPATPAWTTRQVIAHLAGTASDATTGRMDGAPGPTWTARHVDERSASSVAELLAELRLSQADVQTVAPQNSALVFNVVVHHADLTEALGAGQQAIELWSPLVESLRPHWSRLGLRLSSDPSADGADTADVVRVDPYLLYRGLFTRLNRERLRLLTGGSLGDDQLDRLGLFGPPAD